MSNTMAAHEPISYLDSILKDEEEKRCDYGHQWRNYTISRSGRFKSKNRKRDIVDGKFFDKNAVAAATGSHGSSVGKEPEKCSKYNYQQTATSTTPSSSSTSSSGVSNCRGVRDKTETYKSYYETNL